jgi:hypothetical protein
MFARKIAMHLKGSVPEFTQTLEREVIPIRALDVSGLSRLGRMRNIPSVLSVLLPKPAQKG